jgi:hypothetical protein
MSDERPAAALMRNQRWRVKRDVRIQSRARDWLRPGEVYEGYVLERRSARRATIRLVNPSDPNRTHDLSVSLLEPVP